MCTPQRIFLGEFPNSRFKPWLAYPIQFGSAIRNSVVLNCVNLAQVHTIEDAEPGMYLNDEYDTFMPLKLEVRSVYHCNTFTYQC